MKKIFFCFGTRPEAIKLAPLIRDAQKYDFESFVCLTGQHKELIEPINAFFGIKSDANLNVMTPGQSLHQLTAKIISGIEPILGLCKPNYVAVQGDTTSALAGALAAFYLKIPVVHIEAGLRTAQADNPFPEEMNRRLISRLASIHFAPTDLSQQNLVDEGIGQSVFVTGNTGIDALRIGLEQLDQSETLLAHPAIDPKKRLILATVHRRENFENLEQIFTAMKEITETLQDTQVLLPLHKNPVVVAAAEKHLAHAPNVHLVEPLDYPTMIGAMKTCALVLTDSGGLQEEAPYLKKPVLVLRTSTERQEGVTAGVSRIIGNTKSSIVNETTKVLTDMNDYKSFQRSGNPYGDGYATKKIFSFLKAPTGHD